MNKGLIEKYRAINVEHNDWWEHIEDSTKEHLRSEYGFSMTDLYWSGFSSQGDGASFTGAVWEFDTLVNKHQELLDVAPVLCKMILANKADVSFCLVRGSSLYSHENTVETDFRFYRMYHSDEVQNLILKALYDHIEEAELNSFEKAVLELFKDEMRKAYRELEAEYDHLTSDGAVWETIVANELHKEEEEA